MKRKTKKEFNLKGYIFGALRKIWRWYPERRKALSRQEKGDKYLCEICAELFTRKQIHVDHIEPVVNTKTGFVSWDEYIARLFVTEDKLQVLCKKCHSEKTKAENKTRKRKKK